MLGGGRLEHLVSGPRVFIPAAEGFQIHWTKFPLAKRIFNAGFETTLLFLLSYFEPVFDENNPGVHDVFFERGTKFEELAILLFSAKSHDMFNTSAVVPTAVEDNDLARGGKMPKVTLDVHLALFAIRRGWQRNQTEHARTDAFRNCTNCTALAGGVASLKDDHNAQSFMLHPILQFAEFSLQSPKLFFVFLSLEGLFF